MIITATPIYRTILALFCLLAPVLSTWAQSADSTRAKTPTSDSLIASNTVESVPIFYPTPDPTVSSPFKAVSIVHAVANGHKSTGSVDVAFTVTNQSTSIASLIFSTNPALTKAADDLDSVYAIDQVRLGANKKDSGSVVTIELRPDQAVHCGFYIDNVPLRAQYISKIAILTSLSLDDAPAGQDHIVITNLKIIWK